MSHTPGPLNIHINGCELNSDVRLKAGTEVIATIHHLGIGREAEQQGNAHLFAAAPELLDALKNALNVLAGIATGDLKTITADSPAIALCRQAITKAENSTTTGA